MDQVFPRWQADVDAARLYAADRRQDTEERPWVAINMVATVDGAVTRDGRSGGLSGQADKAIFFALRSVADVILVGAGTVRAEDYGPARPTEVDQRLRTARGQASHPTIAVVSGSLQLDPASRLFDDPQARPMILTVESADPARRAALEPVADIVEAGTDHVDPTAALAALARRGARVVLCEGGPTLNRALLSAGAVDEVCLSTSLLLTGGDNKRLVSGATLDPPVQLSLDRQLVDDGFVFSRYLVTT